MAVPNFLLCTTEAYSSRWQLEKPVLLTNLWVKSKWPLSYFFPLLLCLSKNSAICGIQRNLLSSFEDHSVKMALMLKFFYLGYLASQPFHPLSNNLQSGLDCLHPFCYVESSYLLSWEILFECCVKNVVYQSWYAHLLFYDQKPLTFPVDWIKGRACACTQSKYDNQCFFQRKENYVARRALLFLGPKKLSILYSQYH